MCGFNSSRTLLIKDLMITRNADAQAHRGSTSSPESNVVEQVVVIQGTRVSRLAKVMYKRSDICLWIKTRGITVIIRCSAGKL